MGHRARGLQRRRHRLGLLPARPRAVACLPLERGRPRAASAIAISAICFALALWNGRDPILKERLFGLTGTEGNHGEDVKEYYFYLDSTPTHSYMRYLYKYPQAEFPYARLVEENRRREQARTEFELVDTGVFDDDRYFDVFVEYAKADPDDILIRDHGRQPRARRRAAPPAADDLVPQYLVLGTATPAPAAARVSTTHASTRRARTNRSTGPRWLYCDGRAGAALHRERDEHRAAVRLRDGARYFKDGINDTS